MAILNALEAGHSRLYRLYGVMNGHPNRVKQAQVCLGTLKTVTVITGAVAVITALSCSSLYMTVAMAVSGVAALVLAHEAMQLDRLLNVGQSFNASIDALQDGCDRLYRGQMTVSQENFLRRECAKRWNTLHRITSNAWTLLPPVVLKAIT